MTTASTQVSNSSGDTLHADAVATEAFRADVLSGLSRPQPMLPPKYFYDEAGALLFERICEVPAYYPTRTETSILERYASEMAAAIGPHARIIEFGSGSGVKTRILLRHLDEPAAYVPVDISIEQLERYAEELAVEFPSLTVQPVAADYTQHVPLPRAPGGTQRTVVFFPGSTIGNFEEAEAAAFLRHVRRLCGDEGALLIGADLHKDTATLELAYNDPEGVTAEFNLNVLRRINRELGADFPLDAFEHSAVYDEDRMRIEMRLVCTRDCTVRMPAHRSAGQDHGDGSTAGVAAMKFQAGDFIITEYSHKYTGESFEQLAASTGWRVERRWTDEQALFGVWLLG